MTSLQESEPQVQSRGPLTDDERTSKVETILDRLKDIGPTNKKGEPCGAYLYLRDERGLDPDRLPPSIKCLPHGAMHGRGAKFGALVAIATDDNGEPWAVQSTYIYPNGRRVPKGAINDGVDKRTNAKPGWVGKAVVRFEGTESGPPILAEGVESGLAAWQALEGKRTVWVTLGMSYLGAVPLPPRPAKGRISVQVAGDVVEVDSDAERIFMGALARLHTRGCVVNVSLPPKIRDGYDFNDLLRDSGPEAVREAMQNWELADSKGVRDRLDALGGGDTQPDAPQHDVEHKPDEWPRLLLREQQDIPRIPWEVSGFLLRRTVSLVNGHGGSGKSILMLRLALACALNQSYADWKPVRPLRVLICNAEDGLDILDMRLEAALMEFEGDDRHQLASARLFTRSAAYGAMHLVTKEPDEEGRMTIRKTDFFQRLSDAIVKLDIGLLVFDPAISAHAGLDENSNADMQALHDAFAQLARTHDMAVALVHHSSKSAVAGSQHGARGASALVDACRVVISVDPMSEEEAKLLLSDAEQRVSYFCVREAKQNYAIKRRPQWFKLTSVKLANGETAPGIDLVDFDVQQTMSREDMAAFLDEVDAGLPGGARYTKSGKDAYRLDALLTRDFDIPKKQAKGIVKELLDAGVLAIEPYVKPDRHEGHGFVVRHRPGEDDQLPLRGGS